MLARILAYSVCAMLGAVPVSAQTTTATVLGTVTDTQKAILPGTTVTAVDTATGRIVTAAADALGRYRLGGLRPGTYDLRAELPGFASRARTGVQLFVGQEASIDFELAVSAVEESVTVTGEAPLIEVTKSEVSTVINRKQIDALPLSDRNFTDLTRLTPGVVSGDRIGGMQSSLSNTYLVDGVSNDRAWTGGFRSGYSSETIREFRVITEQYAAEYGQASGGVINVVTRSGTNAFEGRGFVYERAEALDATNAFATSKAPFSRQQFGGFAGGPITKNRLFYFGSYEGIRQDQTAVVNTPVQRANFPQPTRQHQAFGKADAQLGAAHQLSVRYNEERADSKNSGVGGRSVLEYGSTSYSRNHDLFASLTSVFGSARLNELRVQVARRPGGSLPNGTGPELLFASSNQGKAYSDPQETVEQRVQVVDNFSWHVTGLGGEHDFKTGFDYSNAVLDGYFCNYCDGTFTFPRDIYDPADPRTYPTNYTQRLGSSDFRIPLVSYSTFLQDGWRPRKNVTVNAGVRFDRVEYAEVVHTNDFSPRLAVSFDPWNTGKTVFRVGSGIFRDKITLNQWLIIVLNVINAKEFLLITNPGYPDPRSGKPAVPAPANTEMFDPNLSNPYAIQATGGVKRELAGGFAASADYLFVRGIHQLRRRDLNAPVNGSRVRPNAALGRQLIHEATGDRRYHALILNVERRFADRWGLTAAYTLSNTKSDSEARNSTTLPTDQYNLRADWGPADADARHNVVVTGQLGLPLGIQFGAILQMRSAFPFNVVSGRDTNNDSRSGDRPDPDPNGAYPTNGVTAYGRFSIPTNRPGTLTRNAFRGPDFARLDVRLSKVIPVGKRRVELMAEAFNLTNRVNYNAFTGSIQSAFFGRPQSADNPRQVQIGARFDF